MALGLCLALALGLLPRLAAALLFFIALGFCERFPGIFSPLDLAFRVSLLWLALLPHGTGHLSPRRQLAWYYLWALQLLIIYFTSFLEKWPNPLWSSQGNAVATVMSIKLYTTALAELVLRFPESILRALTFLTLLIEGVLPWLLLYPHRRLRRVLCLIFLGFHLGIGLTMKVGGFAELGVAWWLLLWPLTPGPAQLSTRASRRDDLRLGLAGLFVLCFSLSAIHRQLGPRFPLGPLDDALAALHLRQGWWMFGRPSTLAQNGWISVRTWDTKGQRENPFLDPSDPRSEFDQLVSKTLYEKKFFTKILKENRGHFFEVLERYLCERWQPRQLDRVDGFELSYQFPHKESGSLRVYSLHRQACQRAQKPPASNQGK